MILPDGITQKLNEVVDGVLPDRGCEVLERGLNHEYWDGNDRKNFTDSDDAHILLK